MRALGRAAIAAALAAWGGHASAAITGYSSQASFQAALDGSYTLVNLDAAPLLFATPYRVDDAGPAAAFLALGVDFVGFNAAVNAGQNGQTPTNRDRLIFNGTGLSPGGEIAVNFSQPVNGIGAFSNNIDFGRVRAFSEAGLGGTFLGETQFGPGSFGGLTSSTLIRSARFTCDGNSDLRCGVYDIQFGIFAAAAIAEPETYAMLVSGFGLLGFMARRRRKTATVTL